MKKFKKLISALMATTLAVSALCGAGMLSGCKNKADPEAIQVSVAKMGYGTEWLHNIAKAYTEKSGVSVQITEEIGQSGNSKISDQVESLVSSIDIAFVEETMAGKIYEGSVSTGGNTYDCLYADLTDLYKKELDGENGATIESKMEQDTKDFLNIGGKYCALPWAGGVTGIVMNNAKWKELGFTDADIPVTTDQLMDICDRIVAKEVSPFIYSASNEYYTMFAPIFFAQYEGNKSMNYFLNGRDPDGNVTEHLYTYDGQVAALRVMKDLIATPNYQDQASESLDFSDMQAYFLNGKSVFCVNGSWLEIEMANYEGADIGFLRTPVISEIVEKATSIKTAATNAGKSVDETLAAVIAEIDAGKTSSELSGVEQEDFNIVKEARSMSYMSSGGKAVAYIPSYSTKVEKAKDFLAFMYSDAGLNIYYETLKGATIPVTPTNGYTADITLTPFRQAINKAETDGFIFNYATNAKVFVLGGVDRYFRNGTTTIVSNFKQGATVEQVITANKENIASNWSNIKQYI